MIQGCDKLLTELKGKKIFRNICRYLIHQNKQNTYSFIRKDTNLTTQTPLTWNQFTPQFQTWHMYKFLNIYKHSHGTSIAWFQIKPLVHFSANTKKKKKKQINKTMKQSPHTENSLAFSLKRFHPQKQKSTKISPGKHCKWTKRFVPKASPSLSQERTPRIHTSYKKTKKQILFKRTALCILYPISHYFKERMANLKSQYMLLLFTPHKARLQYKQTQQHKIPNLFF